MPDYTDVLELQRRRAQPATAAENASAARIRDIQRQAAERMARLLEGDEWQTFRVLVQGFIDDTEAEMARWRETIEAGWGTDGEIARAARMLHGGRAALDAYRRVLAIPSAVIEQAPPP